MKQSHLFRLGIVVLLAGSISFAGGLPNRVLSQDESLETITLVNVDRLEPISPLWQPEDVGMPGAGITITSIDENLLLLGNLLPVQVRVLDIERNEFGEIVSLPNAEFLYHSALNASAGYAAVNDERTLYLANLSSLEVSEVHWLEQGNSDYIDQPVFVPSTSILAYTVSNVETHSPSNGLHLYDFSQEKEMVFISYPGITTFDFREDRLQYVLAGANGDVSLWDSVTGEISTVRASDGRLIVGVSYLDATSILVDISDDSGNQIELWDLQTKERIPIQRRGRSDSYIGLGLAETRDLTGVQFWLPLSNQNLARVEGVQIQGISVRADLLITSTGTDFDFRRLDTGEIMYTLSVPDLSNALLTGDDRRMVFWNNDGNIQVWGIPAT